MFCNRCNKKLKQRSLATNSKLNSSVIESVAHSHTFITFMCFWQWRTQKMFIVFFIQWHMVVIFIWYVLFVMSQLDVIFMFQTNVLAKFVDIICIFVYTHLPYSCVIELNINQQYSRLGRRKMRTTLWHSTS